MGRGKKRFRIWRPLVLLLVLIAVLPYLVTLGPIRDLLIARALPKMNGRASTGSVSLGWLSPACCENLEVVTADGDRAVLAGSLEGDTPLWKMAVHPGAFGGFRTKSARVDLLVDEHGVNLTRLLVPQSQDRPHQNVSMRFDLVDGVLGLRSASSRQPWEITPINLAVELQPANATADGRRALLIHPGTVLKRAAVTPEMWAELLPYVLPMAADSTNVAGELSVELDEWRIPLDDPQLSTGTGRLIVHRLEMTPGPLFRKLAALLRLTPTLRVVPDSTIAFQMRQQRLEHHNLMFAFPTVIVRTNGSVGLDKTLEVVVDFLPASSPLRENLPPAAVRHLMIPIRGTLAHPDVDTSFVTRSGVDLIHGTIDDFFRRRKGSDDPSPPPAQPAPEPHKPNLIDKIKGAFKGS